MNREFKLRYNLRSMQIFEAVARNSTLKQAANELGITQGAVSQQIHKLSEDVGEVLFVRNGRQLVLTPQGRRLAKSLRVAFQEIESSFSETIGSSRPIIRVVFCSAIGNTLLLPRCREFLEDNNYADFQFIMYSEQPDFSESVGDVFITTTPSPAGYWSRILLEETLVPVAKNSSLLEKFWSGRLPLVSTELEEGVFGLDWHKWSKSTGLSLPQIDQQNFLRSSHFVISRDLAMQGLGIALIPDFLADQFLITNELQAASQYKVKSDRTYYISVKQGRRYEDIIRLFIKRIVMGFNSTNFMSRKTVSP